MSNAQQPAQSPAWPLAVAVIGVFAIFLIIMALAHTPVTPLSQATNVPPEEQWKLTEEGRKGRLAEIRGAADARANSYGWVNQDAGVVHVPVDRAIELTLADIQAKR